MDKSYFGFLINFKLIKKKKKNKGKIFHFKLIKKKNKGKY
jgi:hypothetical protein